MSDGKCRGWRLAEALLGDLHFIQRAQKSHRKYWDRSMIQRHMEKELGARGVKAGDLHADSQPSVFPPPQVGTAPYVPVKKGNGTSLILLPSSPTVPDWSTGVRSDTHSKTCCRSFVGGKGRDGLRAMTQNHLPFQSWRGRGLEVSCLGEAPVSGPTP